MVKVSNDLLLDTMAEIETRLREREFAYAVAIGAILLHKAYPDLPVVTSSFGENDLVELLKTHEFEKRFVPETKQWVVTVTRKLEVTSEESK